MYPKEFSVVLGIGLILICVYLLMTGRLGPGHFALSILASGGFVALLHNLEAIESLTYKHPSGGEAVVQMQRIREDVYAKAEQIKKTVEQTAALLAWNVSHMNRFTGPAFQDAMLDRRDEIDKHLAEVGTSEVRREEILRTITQTVDRDMRRHIANAAHSAANKRGWEQPKLKSLAADIQTRLDRPDRLEALTDTEAHLKTLDIWTEEIAEHVAHYRRLLETRRLPQQPKPE